MQRSATLLERAKVAVDRRRLLIIAFAGIGASAHAQVIFSASERVDRGELFTISGHDFDSVSQVNVVPILSTGRDGTLVSAPILFQNDHQITAQVPTICPNGMYRVTVTSPLGTSNYVMMNRARGQWTDTESASPGNIVRLVGRNLRPKTSVLPTIRLVNIADQSSFPCTIYYTDRYQVKFSVPSGVVSGQTYRVYVNNGIAGSAYETNTGILLSIKAKGPDPFNLKTPWASELNAAAKTIFNVVTDSRLALKATPDDNVDDTAAVQAALTQAGREGGGTVFLPAGRYRLDGGPSAVSLTVPANVVLRGAGKGVTTVDVGYRYTATKAPAASSWWLMFAEPGCNGLMDMTVVNQNANATANRIFRRPYFQHSYQYGFVKNVDCEMGNAATVLYSWTKETLIENCSFISDTVKSNPLDISHEYLHRFVNNTVDFRNGRIRTGLSDRSIFEGNTIRLNNNWEDPAIESGGIETSFSQRVLIAGNSILGYGPARTRGANDGELILTQRSVVPDFGDVGSVQSVSGTSFYPANKIWPTSAWTATNYKGPRRLIVAIVEGKGAGQWRWVISNTATSLTVNRAWDVEPNATSTYDITTLTCYQQTIINNRIENGRVGISLYSGAFDTVVGGNQLVNTGYLGVRADARLQTILGAERTIQQIAWNTSLVDNVVTNTTGYRPATVTAYAISSGDTGVGANLLNVDIRSNVVYGNFTFFTGQLGVYDGYESLSLGPSALTNPNANLGTILSNNSVTGSNVPLRIVNTKSTAVVN